MKKVYAILSSAFVSTMLLTTNAQAGSITKNINAEVTLTSNYMYRGLTQTAYNPAVQATVEYKEKSGLYLGTWASSLAPGPAAGYEQDLFAGVKIPLDTIKLDAGFIYYAYPVIKDADVAEIYANVELDEVPGLTTGINISVYEARENSKVGDFYFFADFDKKVTRKIDAGATFGFQGFSESGADSYLHMQVRASLSNFTFSYDKAFLKAAPGAPVLSISYSHPLDL